MADQLAFDILARDKASASFRAAAAGAADLAKDLDVAALSSDAASEALKKVGKASDLTAAQSSALARVLKQTGSEEDKLAAKSLLAAAAVKRLDTSMEESEGAAAGLAGEGAAGGLQGVISPMGGLIAAAVILSPVLITIGIGLAGFAAAAAGVIGPIVKASQATGGLAANLKTLDPAQRNLAGSVIALEGDYKSFQQALEPEVFTVFNAGLKLAKNLMSDVEPVAKATGSALGGFLGTIDAEFKSQTWQQFFTWMAANVGPDLKLVGADVVGLLDDLPQLLEEIQPLAQGFLTLVGAAEKVAGALTLVGATTNDTASKMQFAAQAGIRYGPDLQKAGSLWDKLGDFVHGTGGAALFASGPLNKAGTAAKSLASNSQDVAAAAKVTTSSITKLGGESATSAAEVTALYNALHKLLDPLTQNIQDAVTFKNDQVTLAAALKKSHDVLGLHTAAQRASSTAAAQAAQDALTLSNSILTQTGSASKAAKPLEALVTEMTNAGVHGGAAAALIRQLEAAIASLRSKTVTITVLGNGAGTVTHQGGGGSTFTPGPNGFTGRGATGGPASGLTLVGEHGPELLKLPAGSFIWNHAQTAAMMSGHSGGSTTPALAPRGGGGTTVVNYNLNVGVLPGNEREAGRIIVEKIRKFEQGSGSSWRK